MLNNNALISFEDVLIYLRKYTSINVNAQVLVDTGDHKTYSFPNTFLVEGMVTILEGSDSINSDINTIDYKAGTASFRTAHGALKADYTYLRFDYTDRYNLERLINSVSDTIERYLDKKLKTTTYTDEAYPGNYRQKLLLKQWPITALTSVKIDECILDASAYELSPEDAERGFIFKEDGWPCKSYLVGYVGEPGPRKRTIKVTYSAGYSVIPSDIQDVAIQMVADAVMVQKTGANGVTRLKQGELDYAFGTQQGISQNYTAKLDKYKRWGS